jgi:hypothetical protein
MLELKLPFMPSVRPNPNGMDRWAEGKTNTSCRTYRDLHVGLAIEVTFAYESFCVGRRFLIMGLAIEVTFAYESFYVGRRFLIMIWIIWWKTIVLLPKFLPHPLRQPRLRLFDTHCVWPMCMRLSSLPRHMLL